MCATQSPRATLTTSLPGSGLHRFLDHWGMASQQGAVTSVREFAAAHANHEEKQRSNRQVTEFLQLEKLEDAQRRMAEHARYVAGRFHSMSSLELHPSIVLVPLQ